MDLIVREIYLYLILPSGSALLTWFLITFYKNYISIKPRLILKMGTPLYRQHFLNYGDGRHELTWSYGCALDNNSGFSAYSIKIFEVTTKKGRFIFNKLGFLGESPFDNRIEANRTKRLEIATTYVTKPDELLRSKIENGQKIYFPGLKIADPNKELRPKELKHIRLIVKYENEKGKVFYTKFCKNDKDEHNKICIIKPFFFNKTRELR